MREKDIILSPSLLSCDFARAGEQLAVLEKENVEWLHLDVMDGAFVPNISFGIPVIRSIRKSSKLFFDTHLMINEPERYIEQFAKAGSDCITFHVEATKNAEKVIDLIHACGKKAGVSVKPATPVQKVYPLLEKCELLLVMSVEPGFGGQSYIDSATKKIKLASDHIKRKRLNTLVSVDGGIDARTAPVAAAAGADVLVAGSAVFGKADIAGAIATLRDAVKLN